MLCNTLQKCQAVFGRPTLALLAARQPLPAASPHPRRGTSSAGAGGGDGGRPTAVEVLADAVLALKQDVEAADWVTHEGGRLRYVCPAKAAPRSPQNSVVCVRVGL